MYPRNKKNGYQSVKWVRVTKLLCNRRSCAAHGILGLFGGKTKNCQDCSQWY